MSRSFYLILHVQLEIMPAKLTLNINENIIEDAKKYAKGNSISLSKLIENYLKSLIKKKADSIQISSLVESLTGVVVLEDDHKKEYSDYLAKKYS
jgi:hypothetical protein